MITRPPGGPSLIDHLLPYRCNICNAAFFTEDAGVYHIRLRHNWLRRLWFKWTGV